mmetsp:Transcript_7329/g.18346  ORF Transcript_7329/g.18346 Transcript_7329/m.18346 type:complete len:271 (+) Transcript_7329:83-895(+)|eukprot:CAMPEP_0115231510 /NCGR_PEP_ID=MMETSP0270-20121206/33274_1 /TAXON_ID=71861 /ORGANISM="Scrippsiella trochoidea, Strain CCMP3099" /LENGTH=270 /DNA_ID=CAMNT_0002646147 /DNA_START=98 /DNA_END=910 /DNA_ORIENTATION=+
MAPPTSPKRQSQVKRASVTSIAGTPKPKLMTPKEMIDETLPQFSIEELQDVIRVAQRHLKAKFHERRAAAQADKRSWRFWDRPLSLDWSETGVPKIQYPRGRSHSDSELVWSPFGMLAGMARPPMEVDWHVFEMLSPPSKATTEIDWDVLALMSPKASDEQVSKFMGDEQEADEALEIDWSTSRLPCYNSNFGVRRRRHRVIDQRRCRHPPAVVGVLAEPPAAMAKRFAMRPELAPRVPGSARRAAPHPRIRIHQPGGGAAHVRGVGHKM